MKKFLNLKFIKQKAQAFTLVESLVSIAIVLIAVMAPLTLTLNSVINISQNKSRMIATYLAEEITENLRAYRDGFALACSDLNLTYDTNGNLTGGFCDRNNAQVIIPSSYLKDSDGNISFSNQEIAWKLFLDNLSNVINKDAYLDKNSFNFINLGEKINNGQDRTECNLNANSITGYLCNSVSGGQFSRVVRLTPINGNILKVEVEVVYAKSSLIGLEDKTIKTVNYIYER